MVQVFQETFANFTAAGFNPNPTTGQLDSDIWRVLGFSAAQAPAYGFVGPSGDDFGRGVISGDPTTAGVFAAAGGAGILLQPTGAEFTATAGATQGVLEARIQNTTGAALTQITVAFDWIYRNTGARGQDFAFSYSTNGTSFSPATGTGLTLATPDAGVSGNTTVLTQAASTTITGLNVAAGGFFYLRWTHFADNRGSGNRDEVGIDNLLINAPDVVTNTNVSISDATVVEGNDGTTNLVFTITRETAGAAFEINFATVAGGTATAGVDYTATSQTVSFTAAGPNAIQVSVPVNGDRFIEGAETVNVQLTSSATGVTITDGAGVGTISNDDTPGVISISQTVSQAEGNSGQTTFTFTVTRTGGYGAFTVDYTTIDGTASVVDNDYVAANGQLAFAETQDTATINVTVNGDTTFEPDEDFGVILTSPTNDVTLATGGDSATGVIVNDDAAAVPTLTISPPTISQPEGSGPGVTSYTYTVTRTTTTVGDAVVSFAVTSAATNGADAADFDGGVLPTGTVTIPDGQTSATLTINVAHDYAVEQDEGFVVTLSGPPTGYVIAGSGQATGVIENDDQLSSFSVNDVSVSEGQSGSTALTFTVTRNGGTGPVSVDYGTADVTASAFGDYVGAGGTLSFGANETTKTVTIQVSGDTVIEADETFNLVLSNPSAGATISDDIGVGTITNDDANSTVTINDVTVSEGNSGQTAATFTVTRTGGAAPFTVDFAVGGGTATSGVDYVAASGQVSFAVGELTKTITVQVNGDTVSESTETFNVTLSNATNGTIIGDATGVGTITNDDATKIHDVQGTAFFSPILAAEGISSYNTASAARVTVEGIVVAINSVGGSGVPRGYYVVEETADWDADVRTSEGIFVSVGEGGTIPAGLTIGERVNLTANVTEFQNFQNLPKTFLVNATINSQSNSSEVLPTLVLDGSGPGRTIPNSILSDDNPVFTDSVDDPNDTFDPQNDALDFFETIEGMRVTFPNAVVADGFVSGSNDSVRFKAYSLANADADQINSRGGYTIAGDPAFSIPDTIDPQDDVIRGGRHLHDGDTNPDIIEIDFAPSQGGIGGTSAYHQLLDMGDRLGDVTGILTFDFSNVKLVVQQALDPARVAQLDDTTPVQETTTLTADSRALRFATFNVRNLSPIGVDGDENPIPTQQTYNDLARAIAVNLGAPDIITLEEIQDNTGVAGGTNEADVTWTQLVAAVNSATGKTYQWVDQAPINGQEGGAPGGNIRVGFLYDTARVQLGDGSAAAAAANAPNSTITQRRAWTDRIGDGTRDAGDLIAFSDNMLGSEINTADWANTRRSLLGQFSFNGNSFFVTGNHWPSKGGSGQFYQIDQNIDAGNPENADWAQRNQVAQDVWAMQNYIATQAPNARLLLGGDFNDFYFYRPLEVVTGSVDANGNDRTAGLQLSNLLVDKLSIAERFTYDFDGRSQAIDFILSDQALAAVGAVDVVHINTGYNGRTGPLDVDPSLSDHDPVVSQFDLRGFGETLTAAAGGSTLEGFGGDDTLNGGPGNDTFNGGTGNDTINGAGGNDTAIVDLEVAGADRVNLGAGDDVVQVNAKGAGQVRLTFTSSEVGNGSANDAGTAANQDGGLAVRFQLEGVSDTLPGASPISRYDDEGIRFVANAPGLTFDVRDLVSGAARGDQFTMVALGTSAGEAITGTAGADYVNGGQGADGVVGLDGDDFLVGGAGTDTLDGGVGADSFIGGADGDTIVGGAGVDTAIQNLSTDGADTVNLGEDFDVARISANGVTPAATGQVRVTFTSSEVGNGQAADGAVPPNQDGGLAVRLQLEGAGDTLPAGNLVSRYDDEGITFLSATAGLTFDVRDLVSGAARGDQFTTVALGTQAGEALNGGGGAEYLNGGGGDDLLLGLLGDDFLVGGGGNDRLEGGGGNDQFIGGAGNDRIIGGAGFDTLRSALNFASVSISFLGGDIVIQSSEGLDRITGVERFVFADRTIDRDQADGVDDLFYLFTNPDVAASGLDADDHYNGGGAAEGRNPNAFFDRAYYLQNNPDVAGAGIDPYQHYLQGGFREGRDPSPLFDTSDYLQANPDVASSGVNPLIHYLTTGAEENRPRYFLFDDSFYLDNNPDVLAARIDPLLHWRTAGRAENRDPHPLFDADGYLAAYPDVAAAGVNPIDHYFGGGWTEGRDPSTRFDTTDYLAANPDVAAAGINPLLHYLLGGRFEGRLAYDDGVFG